MERKALEGFEEINKLVLELTSDTYAQFKEINRTIEGIEQELNSAWIQGIVKLKIRDFFWIKWAPDNIDASSWIYSPTQNTYYPQKSIYTFKVYKEDFHDTYIPLRHAPNSIIKEALKYIPTLIANIRDEVSLVVKDEDETRPK